MGPGPVVGADSFREGGQLNVQRIQRIVRRVRQKKKNFRPEAEGKEKGLKDRKKDPLYNRGGNKPSPRGGICILGKKII